MNDAWNVRTTDNPLVRRAGRILAAVNARHPWNHNAHFHPWILRHLPTGTARVLDVGCGRGDLVAALAGALGPGGQVEGIDPDPEMAFASATRFAPPSPVRIRRRTLAEHAALPEHAEHYDAVTMVASLHHMELDAALGHARALLRPGGRLLVVTLTRPVTTCDQVWDLAGVVTNPLIGLAKHPRPARSAEPGPTVPVRKAAWSLGTLREQAGVLLPGAVIRRREGFRATLRWRKPGEAALSPRRAGR
ncbi:class I SAM-dependent methyltransferase [Brachybacterium sp.]|uniref:class I SAM-dependent methyltransferase n=1 Tax=Brachybacterium sp. TaxID=1891286 RepID=UPI002ED21083